MPVMQAVPTFPTQTLLTRCMNLGNFAAKTGVHQGLLSEIAMTSFPHSKMASNSLYWC
jgi:hypothetical protein